jgi:hypothetical protein
MDSAVYEKADMEGTPPDTASYKVVGGHTGLLTIRWPEKRARQTATADLHVQRVYRK